MEGEVVAYQGNHGAVVNFEEYAMSTDGVVKQVKIIQDVMREVMTKDEHYGTIPGTERQCPDCKGNKKVNDQTCPRCNGTGKLDRPSLYKPGAEKLSLTFRLRPEYDIRRTDLANGHREYEVVCTLYHIPTGQSVGQGVGSATTMEGKYRFRPGPVELTDKPVPQEYWNTRDINLLGGKGFAPKKNDAGKWVIAIKGEVVEHDNPADYYNTVLKMAKKRAHVDAILTATAASDIFTQDVEDMPEVIPGAKTATMATPPAKPPIREPQKKAKAQEAEQTVTVLIKNVESKNGEKDGKAYTIFTIHDTQDNKYGTFSDTFADLARSAQEKGEMVNITFTTGKFGNKITDLSPVVQEEQY